MHARKPTIEAQNNNCGRKHELFQRVSRWLTPSLESDSTTAHLTVGAVPLPYCGLRNLNHSVETHPDEDLDVCGECLRIAISRGVIPPKYSVLIDPHRRPPAGAVATGPTEPLLHLEEVYEDD